MCVPRRAAEGRRQRLTRPGVPTRAHGSRVPQPGAGAVRAQHLGFALLMQHLSLQLIEGVDGMEAAAQVRVRPGVGAGGGQTR